MIKLLVIKNKKTIDMSNLVSRVRWEGRRGASARSIQVDFLDDDGHNHDRSELDVFEGHQCIFYWKNEELFRGMFINQRQSGRKILTAKAFDNLFYLANNKDTFNFTNTKASKIFKNCCELYGIPFNGVADTGYRIPELPKPNTTAWDVIADALSLTFKSTGIRYYPLSKGGRVSLLERRQNILQWVVETGVNLEDYSYGKSIERIKTRIKLLSKEGTVIAEARDAELEKKIGTFQDVVRVDDTMNAGQLTELVNSTLAENNKAVETFSVKGLGQPEIITGVGVFITVNPLDISRSYYVESDSHTFIGNHHSMSLTLCTATDISIPRKTRTSGTNSSGEINTGDIVQFLGGDHFISSVASRPENTTPRRAGLARVTLPFEKGTSQPIHIIGGAFTNVDGNSNAYGWVRENQVRGG